jgi:hypothetical protein
VQGPKIVVNSPGLYVLLAALTYPRGSAPTVLVKGNDLYVGPIKVEVVDKVPEPHVVAAPEPEGYPI